MTKSDLGNIATGTVLAFGGSILGNTLNYLFGFMIARLLGAESLGLYFLALVIIQAVSAVCRMGMPEGLLRFVAIHSGTGDSPRAKGTIFSAIAISGISSTLLGLVLFIFAAPISERIFKQPDLDLYLRWFAVGLPFFTVFIIMLNSIQALKRMDLVVLVRDFLQPAIMFGLGLIFYSFLRGIQSFLLSYVISTLVALIVAVYFLQGIFPHLLGRILPKFEWRILLAYSLPITVGELSYYIFRWSDTFLLSLYRSPSEVGIYNAALRTTLLLNLLAVSVNALYSPIIADHYHHKRYKELQEILRTLLRWSLTLALPIVLAMALLSGDILSLWGPDFLVGSPALANLAFSQLIFIASSILAFTLLMSGKQYIEVGNTAFVAVLNVLINLLLIPRYGITGAAISMLVSQGMVFILRILEIRFILNISLFTPKYLKPVVALVPVSILAYTAKRSIVGLAHSSIFGSPLAIFVLIVPLIALVYLMVLYILKFEEEDILVWEELQLRNTISVLARIIRLEKSLGEKPK